MKHDINTRSYFEFVVFQCKCLQQASSVCARATTACDKQCLLKNNIIQLRIRSIRGKKFLSSHLIILINKIWGFINNSNTKLQKRNIYMIKLPNKTDLIKLIDFNGMSTCLGLFHAWRLGNCVHIYIFM